MRVTVNDSQFVVPEQTIVITGLALLGAAALIGGC